MTQKWNHAISFNFEVISKNEEPTGEEMLKALKLKVASLEKEKESELVKSFEIFDSCEEE